MTNNIKVRFVSLATQYAREYAERSMDRILDALPEGFDRHTAELIIRRLYITHGEQFADAYKQVFDQHLQTQFSAKTQNRQPLLVCFSGPFGAGKTTLQDLLDSEAPESLATLEAVRFYLNSIPFGFDFKWAWQKTGVYNPENHQGTFAFARAAGAGSKDAAMELATEQGLDLLYPSSLTPHVSDGTETLQNEIQRLQSYKDKGYKIVIIGCAAIKDICLERIAQRDRKPTEAEIVKSVEGFWQHYETFSAIADSSVLLDTGFKDSNYAVLPPNTQLQ